MKASLALLPRLHVGHFDRVDTPVGGAFDRRRIKSKILPSPPQTTLRAFLSHRSKPILPKPGPHLAWRLLRKRITLKKIEHVALVRKQANFRSWHDRIVSPRAQ